MKKIIAYDLGTSGLKTALFDKDGTIIASAYASYPTYYPQLGWREQRPDDWWKAIVSTTHQILKRTGEAKENIACMAVSGYSFGTVPVDEQGYLLSERTMLWSDTRSGEMSHKLLNKIGFDDWYLRTGGNVPAIHPLFKQLWIQKYCRDVYQKTHRFLGTKDYVNYRLTGVLVTDHSYASGSGMYDLQQRKYTEDIIELAGLDYTKQPEILESSEIIGSLTVEAAETLGLTTKTLVVCGGVDNSCMALGAGGIRNGRIYTNLGSSAWIAATTDQPLLNTECYSNVYAHVIPGMYNSAVTIFAACYAYRWLRDTFFLDFVEQERRGGPDSYERINALAEKSPVGANKLLFDPTLNGGCQIDYSKFAKGSYNGLDMKHTRGDMARACLEGVALKLAQGLDQLKALTDISGEMLLVGGGSKGKIWRQILADTCQLMTVISNVGQYAGALGAAAVAAVGTEIWRNYDRIDELHSEKQYAYPNQDNVKKYEQIKPIFNRIAHDNARIGEELENLHI